MAEQVPPLLRNPFKETLELTGCVLTQPYSKKNPKEFIATWSKCKIQLLQIQLVLCENETAVTRALFISFDFIDKHGRYLVSFELFRIIHDNFHCIPYDR